MDTIAEETWEEHDLVCAVVLHPLGIGYNGYVRIPENHPDFGKDYMDLTDVECHGGLTYGAVSKDKKYTWFGFDTAHYGDYWPGIEVRIPILKSENYIKWTKEMVINETSKLAKIFHERWDK